MGWYEDLVALLQRAQYPTTYNPGRTTPAEAAAVMAPPAAQPVAAGPMPAYNAAPSPAYNARPAAAYNAAAAPDYNARPAQAFNPARATPAQAAANATPGGGDARLPGASPRTAQIAATNDPYQGRVRRPYEVAGLGSPQGPSAGSPANAADIQADPLDLYYKLLHQALRSRTRLPALPGVVTDLPEAGSGPMSAKMAWDAMNRRNG